MVVCRDDVRSVDNILIVLKYKRTKGVCFLYSIWNISNSQAKTMTIQRRPSIFICMSNKERPTRAHILIIQQQLKPNHMEMTKSIHTHTHSTTHWWWWWWCCFDVQQSTITNINIVYSCYVNNRRRKLSIS